MPPLSYDDLACDSFAWNAFPGDVHGLLLDRKQPALGLCSYKFYLPQALAFEVYQDGRKCEVQSAQVTWLPHKVRGVYACGGCELILEALFVRAELIAVRYAVQAPPGPQAWEVRVRGISRNGQDKGRFFVYRGTFAAAPGGVLVNQEIDIPDYHMQQTGLCRRFPHHLAWLVGTPQPVDLAGPPVRTSDPAYLDQTNKSGSWQMRQTLPPVRDGATGGMLLIGMRWLGPDPIRPRDIYELDQQIAAARGRTFAQLELPRRDAYAALLRKLPAVQPAYRDHADYLRLYAQAWVCIWQNIAGPLATARKTLRFPSAFVSKICDAGFGPAQWETALAGYLLSFIDPDLGVSILESVVACVEVDGFLPEDLIFNRDVKLSSLEPYMIEEISRRTGRTDFLARLYDPMYRQLVFHVKHGAFQYLSGPGGTHLQIANFYSLLALERIARVLGKDPAHLRELGLLKDDLIAVLDEGLRKDGAAQPMFEFLSDFTDDRRRHRRADSPTHPRAPPAAPGPVLHVSPPRRHRPPDRQGGPRRV
jgi:hypothetical protein